MSGRGRWRRFGAGVVAGGLLAAACSNADGEEVPTVASTPQVSATTPEPPSESPAPGPTPWPEPTRPAAMERDDIEGAKAAAEYFLKLYPYVYVTGDLEDWSDISHPDCQFCESVMLYVQELHDSGGYADGPEIRVTEMVAIPPDSEYEHFAVWVDAREEPFAHYDSRGARTVEKWGVDVEIDLALSRTDDKWTVIGAVATDLEDGSDG